MVFGPKALGRVKLGLMCRVRKGQNEASTDKPGSTDDALLQGDEHPVS